MQRSEVPTESIRIGGVALGNCLERWRRWSQDGFVGLIARYDVAIRANDDRQTAPLLHILVSVCVSGRCETGVNVKCRRQDRHDSKAHGSVLKALMTTCGLLRTGILNH